MVIRPRRRRHPVAERPGRIRRLTRSLGTLTPARLVAGSFILLIAAGTVLLMLPISSADGSVTGLTDAAFTATSATCVTGLITVDTATHWSGFGQVVIISLIQLGGLGLMTMASVIGLALIGRTGLRARLGVAAEGRSTVLGDVRSVVTNTVRFSLLFEAVFAAILTAWWWGRYGIDPLDALWHGVFHSISGFNNAGFALYSDNLMSFAADPVISFTLAAAIISGGLGFPVWIEIARHLRRQRAGRVPALWSMTVKITLVGTAVLIALGTLLVMTMEWNGALGHLSTPGKVVASIFGGITPRTAGFNSLDYGRFHDATLLGTDILMFIGGGSGGTAGGIKVTTMCVVIAAVVTEIRGERSVHLFGRRIDSRVQRQALTVGALSSVAVVGATMAMLFLTDVDANEIMFEVTSAFGTVGLSTGITPTLPDPAHWLLIALMFLGRLGPITLVSTLASREHPRTYEVPVERPQIG